MFNIVHDYEVTHCLWHGIRKKLFIIYLDKHGV